MRLTKREAENLLDALGEWDGQICPKELADDGVGLNAERFDNLMKRLTEHAYSPEVKGELETFEDFAISCLSEKDIVNWQNIYE